jgi:hypothetical protein
VLVLGGVAYALLVYSLTYEVDVALRSVAQTLVNLTRRRPSPALPAEVEAPFRRFFGRSPWAHSFELRDPVGRRDPRWQRSPSDTLPLSPQALGNAAMGLPTLETSVDLGPYPVRILTMPMREAGRVTSLIQVGMSLESVYLTRQRFLLLIAGVLPLGLLLGGADGHPGRRSAAPRTRRYRGAAHGPPDS